VIFKTFIFSIFLVLYSFQFTSAETCSCGNDTIVLKPAPVASCCSVDPTPAIATQSGCGSGCGAPAESLKQKNQVKGTTNPDNDCGVWSLAYIAKSLGIRKDEKAIKKLVSYDPNKGATMQELAQAAQKIGLVAKGYRMSYTELTKLQKPIIVYIPNHFMVLTAVDAQKNRLTFADSSKKKFEMPKDEFLNIWQGYVLEIKKK
jgi:hypothetical protein